MGKDSQGFENGIYKGISGLGFTSTAMERAGLLREVSKSLIRATIPLERRRAIIVDLQQVFGVELSDRGLEQFLGS